MKKLASRKFWLSLAAFLGLLGVSIAGITTENEIVAVAGLICSAISAAIYAACEASVDRAAVNVNEEFINETEGEE